MSRPAAFVRGRVRLTLLFDIDGTLLLSGGAGLVAFERAFEECFGRSGSWGDVVPDGKTDPVIFGEIARRVLGRDLDETEYASLCGRYLEYFPAELERSARFRLMPGVRETLTKLHGQAEWLLGVATGNLEAAAWHKLRRGDLHAFFGFGGFGSDAVRREHLVLRAMERARDLMGDVPMPAERFVIIGDTPLDVAAARANGARVVGVATGSYSEAELIASGADLALADLADPRPLLDYLRSL